MSVEAHPATRVAAPDRVRVVRKHHLLVRLTHWANVPLLFGLIASGLAIYWAAPVFVHARNPASGSREVLGDLGVAIARMLRDPGGEPRFWIYDHLSLGPRQLATSLRLHWALAYLFMLNGALYALGLAAGGGWRALLPRPSDAREALRLFRFYLGVVPTSSRRRARPEPGTAPPERRWVRPERRAVPRPRNVTRPVRAENRASSLGHPFHPWCPGIHTRRLAAGNRAAPRPFRPHRHRPRLPRRVA